LTLNNIFQPGNILTVVQTGIEDYRPIRDESYIELKDIDGGEVL